MKTIIKFQCDHCGVTAHDELVIRLCEMSARKGLRGRAYYAILTDPNVPPEPGDIVWVSGGDERFPGWGIVKSVETGISGGEQTQYFILEDFVGCRFNWRHYAPLQEKLSREYRTRAYRDS